jgi:hypothetical protein
METIYFLAAVVGMFTAGYWLNGSQWPELSPWAYGLAFVIAFVGFVIELVSDD